MKPFWAKPAAAGAHTGKAGLVIAKCWRAFLPLALLTCAGTPCAMAQAADKSNPTPNVTVSEATNRRALEDEAGKNAAKLMLRSVPDKSSVRIGGKPVGKTPLLLIVHPGVYVIEMEGGPRLGYSRQQVDLLPKETREVVMDLKPRYPASVHMSWNAPQ